MQTMKIAALALAMTAPMGASAATTVFEATGLGLFDGMFGDFFDVDGDDVDVGVTVETDGTSLTSATLLVSDASGVLLESGDAFDAMLSGGTASLSFRNLTGSSASLFGGDTARVIFGFDPGQVAGGTLDPVSVQVTATDLAAIPVPASLPLLAAGIGGLALLRRRRG
ncbi:hypothetical protein OCGS_1928 [Oceaniovalibus guishaninsula JLT2003]|uniref:PEP-CTERM protein-sorting domain-containing protein n=1 Tax=Oceaniovalibus guishaninsula JLT2003 TaxID=1231392 RepID=K2HBE1_9RHOB|nr:VPLPA-CTERM sorting domain-containing protein [Oceaniovalibus guishaninsula]EKE43947.1 hypothetical protein OCGS_1928 [Oceaniovalibus guishaninsula JLT2003]